MQQPRSVLISKAPPYHIQNVVLRGKKRDNIFDRDFFYILLTVHLSIFILVINQLDAQLFFYNKFISCLYMFRALCAHRQEVKLYYTASGIIIPVGGRPVHSPLSTCARDGHL